MRGLVVVMALALSAAPAALAKDGKDDGALTIATEGAYAPWNFKDASGKLIGFELDLARELCKRMQRRCRVVAHAWDGIIPSLRAGKFDAIMAGMSITDKRRKVISFSRAYAALPARFVVPRSSPAASLQTSVDAVSLPDLTGEEAASLKAVKDALKGKVIGVQTATIHENFLRQQFGKAANIRTYDTQENLDLDLVAGRVDAALAVMSSWKVLLESDRGRNLIAIGPGFSGGPFGEGVGVGVRKDDSDLANKFSAAIEAASADGAVSRLAVKWFGFDASVK